MINPTSTSPLAPGLTIPGLSVEQRLSAIENQLAALQKLITINTDGSAVLKTTKLTLDVLSFEVKAMQSAMIRSAGSADFQASSDLSIKAGVTASLIAGGQLDLRASGMASVQGAVLKLNGGTKPLARVGDQVQIAGVVGAPGSPIPAGQVTAGSTTILA